MKKHPPPPAARDATNTYNYAFKFVIYSLVDKEYSSYMIIKRVKETEVRSQDTLRGGCGRHDGIGSGLSSDKILLALIRNKLMHPPPSF